MCVCVCVCLCACVCDSLLCTTAHLWILFFSNTKIYIGNEM